MIDTKERVRIGILIIHEITQSPSIEKTRTLMRVCFSIRSSTDDMQSVCAKLEEDGALAKSILFPGTYTITEVGKKMVLNEKHRARRRNVDITKCISAQHQTSLGQFQFV